MKAHLKESSPIKKTNNPNILLRPLNKSQRYNIKDLNYVSFAKGKFILPAR